MVLLDSGGVQIQFCKFRKFYKFGSHNYRCLDPFIYILINPTNVGTRFSNFKFYKFYKFGL